MLTYSGPVEFSLEHLLGEPGVKEFMSPGCSLERVTAVPMFGDGNEIFRIF